MDFQWHVTLRYKVKSHPTLPCPTWGMNYLFVGSIHAVYVVHLWLSHFMAVSLLHGLSQDTHSVSGELLVLIGNNQEQWCWQLCYSIVLLQLFSVTVISCQSLVVPNWRIKCYCRCVCRAAACCPWLLACTWKLWMCHLQKRGNCCPGHPRVFWGQRVKDPGQGKQLMGFINKKRVQ